MEAAVLGQKRQISQCQKQVLVEFIEENPCLATQKFSNQYTSRSAREKWLELTNRLNSIPGVRKEWKEWRKTWSDLKSRAKRKQATNNKSLAATGGGPGSYQELTETESKTVNVMGGDMFVQGTLSVPEPGMSQEKAMETILVRETVEMKESFSPASASHQQLPSTRSSTPPAATRPQQPATISSYQQLLATSSSQPSAACDHKQPVTISNHQQLMTSPRSPAATHPQQLLTICTYTPPGASNYHQPHTTHRNQQPQTTSSQGSSAATDNQQQPPTSGGSSSKRVRPPPKVSHAKKKKATIIKSSVEAAGHLRELGERKLAIKEAYYKRKLELLHEDIENKKKMVTVLGDIKNLLRNMSC